jgi:hypothetical protein
MAPFQVVMGMKGGDSQADAHEHQQEKTEVCLKLSFHYRRSF